MTAVQLMSAPGCSCDAPVSGKALISYDEALARIAGAATAVEGSERLALLRAQGRVLAAPICAAAMTPPFDNAAMDGYAVSTAAFDGDGPWDFPVIAHVPAGQAAREPVIGPVTARILTGAPLPPGADAVVMQEAVTPGAGGVRFAHRPEVGENIRRAGEDMQAGAEILSAGKRLGPREIAACAAAGCGEVTVRRAVRVALVITGDEVRAPGAPLEAAAIWDVNTPMLSAALAGPGVDLVEVSQARDDRDGLCRQIEALAARADLIVTTGGVSVGDADHVRGAFAALGTEIAFGGVAIKPGKPVSFGQLGGARWIGLPGNPLAAFVGWQLFGRYLLDILAGKAAPGARRRHVVLGRDMTRAPGRCELRPAWIAGFDGEGREIVDFESATHSARVGRLPQADGLMFLPAETDALPEGALVEFQPFCDM